MIARFEKWEGLGNDFVLIDGPPLSPELVQRLCDRRRGIGGDGVLFVEGVREGAPRMTVLNADGSRPEMCGNGARCVAAYVAIGSGLTEGRFMLGSDAGPRACFVSLRGDGEGEVTVDMGQARVLGELAVELDGQTLRFATVDVGNPHAVTFAPFDAAAIDRVGPRVATTPPGGTNVEFCIAGEGRIDVVVWERGVGRTLACGTGACAVAAVVCETGRAPFGVPLIVGLPGGDLLVTIDSLTKVATMRGPARRVFRGEVEIP